MLNAVDFPTPENTTIVAAISGIVVQVVENFSTGCPTSACENESNFIVIDHGDSTFAMYAHLTVNGSLVEVGDSVDAGQNIALSGNTGWSTGPHLHFEIKDLTGNSMPLLFYEFENISGGSPFWGISATSENIYVNSGLTFDYSSCQSNQFITMGIQLNSSIPCSVAELDRVYVLTGQTFSPQQRFGVAQYDVDDSQWVYTCYAANADGTFTIDLEWDSTTFTESSYLMIYSADANCYSYQSWYNSIGLWLI
ncbi:MAG: M23 family metallopeptidase [Candidatus Poseidoniaceae archaeon]|nr:M23 family metallopeptidase [Candidatus Poseidoniaceae archaeon]